MITPVKVSMALWLGWLAFWLIAARSTATTVARQAVAARLAHLVFVWAGAALLFGHPHQLVTWYQPIVPGDAWVRWGGVVLVVLGIGFTVWARVHLGRFWSATVTLKAEHALIRSGPYALSRHPIYTGLLLALVGTAISRGTSADAAGLVLIVLGVLLKIRQEEALLLAHFGTAYRAYRQEVPMLIPRLWGA